VAFVRPPFSEGEGIADQPLVDEPMRIALPSRHSQAESRTLPLVALAQESWILFPRAAGPGLYDSIIASCQRAGFSPILGQEAPELISIVCLVGAGFGVSVVPQSIEQTRADGIAYIGIEGEARRAPISLASRQDNRSTTVRNFLALARRQAHQLERATA
jgi:DNA-binding transcriptional LysR family regulator